METHAPMCGCPCLGYIKDEHGEHFNQDKTAIKSDGD